jgi:hypothetical protein
LLQACRSWRAALQQCSAGNLCVCIGSTGGAGQEWKSIQQLSRFCSWLRKQAGLVQEISVACPIFSNDAEEDAYCDAAEQLLVASLQEAAARPLASSAAAAAATAPTAAAAHAVLQLRSFSTKFIRSPALLHALPAAALTQLSLQQDTHPWRKDLSLNRSSIAHALAQLSSLRSLTLKAEVGNACLTAVGKLVQLTHLDIDSALERQPLGCNLQLLPLGLQEVCVNVMTVQGNDQPPGSAAAAAVTLGHLTALRTLELETSCGIAAGSSLPPSLTALTIRACMTCGSPDSVELLGIA